MSNEIHETVIIQGDVKLGKNNKILPYCILIGPLEVGDNNIVGPHVTVGCPGADTKNRYYDSTQSRISIGNHNIIREYSAIQKPCYKSITSIDDHVFLMQGVSVSHDVVIESDVVISAGVSIAGLSRIMRGANLAMNSSIHQNLIIGPYSIVAMGSAAVKNVKPFSRFIPGKPTSINDYAVKKFGFEKYSEEINRYVLESQKPSSEIVSNLVSVYEKFHLDSGKAHY